MRIQILKADEGDWIGLYKDGELVAEGHSIEPLELVEALDLDHDYWRTAFEDKPEWGGHCPQSFPFDAMHRAGSSHD